MRRAVLAGWLACAAVARAPDASAAPAPPATSVRAPAVTTAEAPAARASALFARAAQASEARRYTEALAGYEAALAADPSAPSAAVTRIRIADLRAHSEGDFAPLTRLDEVRRDPSRARDRASLEDLERDCTSFPPGPVRSEARALVAEAYWHELHEPERAERLFHAILEDPSADQPMRSLALAELVDLGKERDDVKAALAAARRHADLAPRLAPALERTVRRGAQRTAALAVVVALGLVGVASLVRAARRTGDVRRVANEVARPRVVAATLAIGAIAAVLVHLRGVDDVRPYLVLGPALLALSLVERAWRLATREARPVVRALRVACCAAGLVALALLIFERDGGRTLDALGL